MSSIFRFSIPLTLAAIVSVATACSEKNADAPTATKAAKDSTAGGAPATGNDHGDELDLGSVTLFGRAFEITGLGPLTPGKEGAFSVSAPGMSAADRLGVGLFLWVEDSSGEQVSSPAKGTSEGDGWHFHATPRADAGAPTRVVLRARLAGNDERAGLPLDGHGHEHVATPHDGVLAAFKTPDGGVAGHLELKLHDDKGDLELWLAKDAKITDAFDVPLASEITAIFIDHEDRAVGLRARDHDSNEDEEGTANVRDGKTNYFIFPGDTGADASWLMGNGFQSIVQVTFTVGDATLASEEFMLTPHTHADGGH